MKKEKKQTKRELEKAIVPRCACGLKKRGPNHDDGPHHQAWMSGSPNAVRRYVGKYK